jgi:hypothetical protein
MAFNKKVLSKAVSELGKAKAPGKPKDIITDPAGQWKYPGQKTRIPSNDITMQGVPYPVWAQPNVGPGSMMQPNQDYNFPGASYVDETPMAKKGGSKLGTINLNPNPLSHYELNYGFNLPAKENGGEADYEDLDLTDEEIQAYRDGGYIVEDIPEAQVGGPQNTAGPRNEVEPEAIPVGTEMSPDYDLRKFYTEDPMAAETFMAGKGHATDKYKLPNHPTFSNQSMYNSTDTPGGEWIENEDGAWSFNASQINRSNMSNKDLKSYFDEVEPGNTLNYNPIKKQGGYVQHELVKAQKGKTVYSGPKFGLVGPSTPKTNGAPTIANAKILEAERKKAALAKQQALAKQKEDELMRGMPKTQVSDNTRTVIPNQAISDINNAAFYNSPQETANREARKKEQAAFEKEQWNKYNKMSFAEKALDRTQAAIAHPILMAGNALAGNQGYIPGMGRGLMNTESPEYDKYLKATGQTKGQFEISDLANIVNPGYWAGNAGNELHKGNYIKGVTDLGLGLMGLKGAKNASGLVKGSANALNKAESKISKLIPERAPDTSVNTGLTLNAGISPQLIQNAVGPKSNRLLANLTDHAYIGPFFSKTINKYSPLNLIKSYGSKLEGPVKSLGNVLGNSIKNNKLIGGKSLFGKHRGLSTQVGKTNASNIYAAKFDDAVEGSRFQLGEANPQSRFSRKSNATFPIQNKVGDDIYDLPVSDPGVALHRRLPFSNRYVPIDKQKLMNNKFQWSTTGAGLQNVVEKYGKNTLLGGLGYGAYNAYNYDENNPETRAEMFAKGAKESYESPVEYVKNPDPYFVNSIYQGLNPTQEEKNGGSIESWEDDLDDEEIRLLKEAGFIVEELK